MSADVLSDPETSKKLLSLIPLGRPAHVDEIAAPDPLPLHPPRRLHLRRDLQRQRRRSPRRLETTTCLMILKAVRCHPERSLSHFIERSRSACPELVEGPAVCLESDAVSLSSRPASSTATPAPRAQARDIPSAAPTHPAGETQEQRGRKLLDQMLEALGGDAWLNRHNMRVYGHVGRFFRAHPTASSSTSPPSASSPTETVPTPSASASSPTRA